MDTRENPGRNLSPARNPESFELAEYMRAHTCSSRFVPLAPVWAPHTYVVELKAVLYGGVGPAGVEVVRRRAS